MAAPLDSYDLAILDALQRDARLSSQALAEQVHLSPTPCWRRLKRLERAGYIEGYHAHLNRRRMGLGVVAFVAIETNPAREKVPGSRSFDEAIRALDAVIACHAVSGESDYILEVLVPSLDHYAQITHGQLLALPGVTDVHTSFSLRSIKETCSIPLAHLALDERAQSRRRKGERVERKADHVEHDADGLERKGERLEEKADRVERKVIAQPRARPHTSAVSRKTRQ